MGEGKATVAAMSDISSDDNFPMKNEYYSISTHHENYSANNLYNMMTKMNHNGRRKSDSGVYCKKEAMKKLKQNDLLSEMNNDYCKKDVLQKLKRYDFTSDSTQCESQEETLPSKFFDDDEFEIVDGLIQFVNKKSHLENVLESIQQNLGTLARNISFGSAP